ncbi:MAG: cadherin-like beta sandwich domain-containing protein, partial [Phycisphaerae bacterium]|nr:cadherin-like beta sandwich domain-containing protein [Phycisphaerae bacterium]
TITLDAQGSTTVAQVVITAQDGTTTQTYTLNIHREEAGTCCIPYTITTNPAGTWNAPFTSGTLAYTIEQDMTVTSVDVAVTTTDPLETVTINGTAGPTATIALGETGSTTVAVIMITSQDGTSTLTYTLNIHRAENNDSTLSDLATSPAGTWDQAFTPATMTYHVEESSDVTSVDVAATANDPNAYVSINGMSGATRTIALGAMGSTTVVTIVITAQDGITTATYTLHISIGCGGTDSSLSGLTVSAGNLSPAFASGTLTYSDSIPYCTSSMNVTATVNDPMATLTINGSPATSGSPVSVTTSGPSGTITILVTDHCGTGTTTYTINWARGAQPNVNLSAMTNALHRASGTEPSQPFVEGNMVYSYTNKYDQNNPGTYPFDENQLEYTIVPHGNQTGSAHTQEIIHLGATLAAPSEATMTINGVSTASGGTQDIVLTAGGYEHNGNVLAGTQPTVWRGTTWNGGNIRAIQIVVTGNAPNTCVTKTYTVYMRLLNIYEAYYGSYMLNSEYERMAWGVPPASDFNWTKNGAISGNLHWVLTINSVALRAIHTQTFTNFNPDNYADSTNDVTYANPVGVDWNYRVPHSDGAAATNGVVSGTIDMYMEGTFTSTGLTLTHPSGMPLCTFTVNLQMNDSQPEEVADSYYNVTYMGITKRLQYRSFDRNTGRTTATPYDLYTGYNNGSVQWDGDPAWDHTLFPAGTAAP